MILNNFDNFTPEPYIQKKSLSLMEENKSIRWGIILPPVYAFRD